MDGFTIYMRLAEAWSSAAHGAANTALKACYADRAARYLALALSEERCSVREASAARSRGGNPE